MKKLLLLSSVCSLFSIVALSQEVTIKNIPLSVRAEKPLPVTLENRFVQTSFNYMNLSPTNVNPISFYGDVVIQYFNIVNTLGAGNFYLEIGSGGKLFKVPLATYNTAQPATF